MVRSKRLVALVVALAVPLAGTLVAAGSAGAAKGIVPTGQITCAFGQTITFNPPLTPLGTLGVSQDVITFTPAHVTGCAGTTTPSNALPTFGTGTKRYVYKWKAQKGLAGSLAGPCVFLDSLMFTKYKGHYTWSATGLSLKADKIIDGGYGGVLLSPPPALTHGFRFDGMAKGSFPGPVTIQAYFDPASNAAWNACIGGVVGSSVASLTVDPTVSTIQVGTP